MPRAVTVDAFLAAFATVRYEPCFNGELEMGVEKIALFTLDGKPTHAARQLPDGRWTSKLGKFLDITHTLAGLEGPVYGQANFFLKRTKQA